MNSGKDNSLSEKFFRNLMIFAICFAIALFCIYLALDNLYNIGNAASVVLFIGLYLIGIALFWIISKAVVSKSNQDEDITPALGNVMLDVITRVGFPVVLCDETGKLIWYNKSFILLVQREKSLYGLNIDIFCSASLDKIIANSSDDGMSLVVNEKFMKAKTYRVKTSEKLYYIVTFADNTKYVELRKQMKRDYPVVAYAAIDNLEELMQYVKEMYQPAATEIDNILRSWVAEMGGIIKEYDKNKYLIFMRAQDLDEAIANKFEVLEKIRNVRVGKNITSATVSMGISKIEGSFEEQEQAAKAALDMALQRGGDQAVVKSAGGIEFFGGKVKTLQKRTKVEARVNSNKLCMHISKSDNVLVMGHKYPDFDSFGACIGIARLSMFCGVPVKIVLNKKDPRISDCVNKICAIEGYEDIFADSSNALDLINTNTLLVLVDTNNFDIVESPEIAKNVFKKVIIDHHRKTAEFAEEPLLSYIEPSASSACELVAEMLEQCLPEGTLQKDEADMLLMGMILDTKQFSRNTGMRTFSAAVYLRGERANPADIQSYFKSDLDAFIREAKFESNVVIYRNQIAISLSETDGTANDRVAAAKVADKLLLLKDVEASFALIRIDDTVHISARSSGKINVQLILEKLDGGGHFDVAGAQVANIKMADALEMLKKSIDEYLNNQ